MDIFRMQVKTHFDAAHYLKSYVGKCSNMHGHRWDIEVCLQAHELDVRNMLVDFVVVKAELKRLLDEKLDHYLLNESLGESNPTAEFLARWLFKQMEKAAVGWGVRLVRTCVWESPDCCVEYASGTEVGA